MKTITQRQLINKLFEIDRPIPIAFTALTTPKVKAGCPYDVRKLCRVQAFIAFNYEKSVNRQAAREGKPENFQVSERKWGERLGPVLVKHGDKFYISAKVERKSAPLYFAVIKGRLRTLLKSQITPFLVPEPESTAQGLDKPVVFRNYSLENIKQISMNGNVWKIRQ